MLDQSLHPTSTQQLASFIKVIPDFPKPGILFRDISPLLAEPKAFTELISRIAYDVQRSGAEKIVGLEARGFIVGIAVAQHLGLPFVAARKAGKLPGETIAVSYALEYGSQTLEMQAHSVNSGEKVAVIDDLLATGGTAAAAGELISKLGGEITGYFFAIELSALQGRALLGTEKTHTVMSF